MLVLSRYRNESVKVGDDIVVTVVEVRGDKVRLGFEAPKDIPIFRTELIERTTSQIPRHHFNGDEPID